MRLPSLVEHQRGSITAEFAVIMPGVLLVLIFVVGTFQVVSEQIRVVDASAIAARSLGRGESEELAVRRVDNLIGGHEFRTSHEGDFVCVSLKVPINVASLALSDLMLSARSCAPAAGL